jgi:signal transduction histidine kinase
LLARAQELALINEPIPIVVNFPETDLFPATRFVQKLYYGESDLVARLRWFPYIQLLFVGLFVLVGYFGFSYIRRSEQSSLWVGMAKEAAHQLGTPISSLMGWVEMLRLNRKEGASNESDEEAFLEIEKDIDRLERVTSRFSDIGSLPKLDRQPIALVLETTADYIRRRLPKRGAFIRVHVDDTAHLEAPLNADLFEWVIENLLKNALDAMEDGRGTIRMEVSGANNRIRIDVSDTGKGIDRRQWKNIFRPGYSTKQRGWGLGLSLAKRIIEDYHGGSLTLVGSRLGEGTTFRIEIPDH